MDLRPPAPVVKITPEQEYENRLRDFMEHQRPEMYKDFLARGVREHLKDRYDMEGMPDDEVLDAHYRRFGRRMTPEQYQQKMFETYGQGWVEPDAPLTPSEEANKKRIEVGTQLAVGAAPYVSYGVANALAAAAKWGEHAIPVVGQVAAAAGHGINMLAQRGEAETMSAAADKVSDADLAALAKDFYDKAAPGLIAKGYSPEQVRSWTLHRAANVIRGGEETAASMNAEVADAMKQEAAGSIADVATFGIDTKTGKALVGAARDVGKGLVGGVLRNLGVDSVTRGVSRVAINPFVRHFGTGALYGATDMGIRSAAEKAQDDLLAGTPLPELTRDIVVSGATGAAAGGAFGGVLGGALGAPLEKLGEHLNVQNALKEHLAAGGTKKDFVAPKPAARPLPFEPKPNASKAANTSPVESRPGFLRPATSEEVAALRNFRESTEVRPADDFTTTINKVNPLVLDVVPGTEHDVAKGIVVSEHGPASADEPEGMRAVDAIAQKLKLYNDANAEMALHVRPAGPAPTAMGGQAVGTPPLEEAAPTAPAPVPAGPVLGGIESGGQLPPALSPPQHSLPSTAPSAGVSRLATAEGTPPAVPPGLAGGEAPIMSFGQPTGSEPTTLGERALPAPPAAAAPPTTEQLAEGWSKELGFTPKKSRARYTPKIKAEKERETNPAAQNVVETYRAENGFKDRPGREMHPPLNKERGRKIAQEYENLKTAEPGTPEYEQAVASYNALNAQVADQYDAIKRAGYNIEFTDTDPYKSSGEMRADVRDNKTLKVLKTPEGHHPFMSTDESNKFRAVHDFFGHAAEGFEFGPRGEEAAFRQHAATLSNAAIPALASETRGQNSWVNFMPQHEALPAKERPFAEQKGGLLPEHTYADVLHGERVPVETKPEGIHIGVPVGDASSADLHAALNEAVEHADAAGLPITADLTRIDAPQGGRIPVEKQFESFYEPRGFKMTELVRSPEGQIQTARVRRDAIKPPKGGVLEAQGTMYERIAKKADTISKAAGDRLNKKLGRANVGFDPTMIGDAALEMTGAMFARGIRGVGAMHKYLTEKYGKSVAPHLDRIVALAQKHFLRFFKSEEGSVKSLDDLLALKESGKYGMNWYEKTAKWAKKNLGPDADMFLRFLAVTSANGQTESGAALALKAFAQWKAGLAFTGMRGPSMTGQLERIAKGENLGDMTKIENFYRALKGDPNAVVLDRWMLRAMHIPNDSSLKPNNYKLYAAAVKHLADMNDMTPRQFQAAVWEGARVGNIIQKEAAGGRREATRTGSARPLEDLIDRKLDGMSMDQYIGEQGQHLKRMENIYKALEPVRKGESVGHTFNLDTMEPDTEPGYVVSLVSTNVPKTVLYPGRIDKVLGRVQPLIDHLKEKGLHPTLGVFASELHPGQFSIDLNVTLPSETTAQSIATANRQESFAHLGPGGQWIENIPSNWDRKGKQYLPPKDGRLHREWYAGQINRVKRILKETL